METVKTIKNLSDYFNRFTFHISDVYHIVTCTRKYKSKIFLWCCIFTLPLNVVNHELNWTILLDTLSVLTSGSSFDVVDYFSFFLSRIVNLICCHLCLWSNFNIGMMDGFRCCRSQPTWISQVFFLPYGLFTIITLRHKLK